ncbi:uncharacterized protein [Antedon mediterranea]|uniref:uncharacterized protein isoform X2 n=1 Tax=Antedon mediterranea TaxID=105859 RepID=UPI003AF85B38
MMLAILKHEKEVGRLLTRSSKDGNFNFQQLHVIEEAKRDVCVIELSEVIAELEKSLRQFKRPQKMSTCDGGALIICDDWSSNLYIAMSLTEEIEEYLRAWYTSRCGEVGNVDVTSQSFLVTGFPAGMSSDKIQIALQRTKSGGGEVECIHPVGALNHCAIAIFADSHVANNLKKRGKFVSDKFPDVVFNIKALTDLGDLGGIQVKGLKEYPTNEQTKDRLTINLQRNEGGDVDDIIYPFGSSEDIAFVKFEDDTDRFLQKEKIIAKEGATLHFKKVLSFVKCFKKAVILEVSDVVHQIPKINEVLKKQEGVKWTRISNNKYLFYTEDCMKEFKSIVEQGIMNKQLDPTGSPYRQHDVKHPPMNDTCGYSDDRTSLDYSMAGKGAESEDMDLNAIKHLPIHDTFGYSNETMAWNSPMELEGEFFSTESFGEEMQSGRSNFESIINDLEYTLLNGTKLIIRHGDITDEDVDVIVNAANCSLTHSEGVALAIAKKAGPDIQDESYDSLQVKGRNLFVTEFEVTAGYKLKARHVIHAVGPDKHEYDFSKKLYETFYHCLDCANSQLNARTIALPLISSGISGGDVQVCAEVLSSALFSFQEESRPYLKEIRIVSNLLDVSLTIQDTFKGLIDSNRLATENHTSEFAETKSMESKQKLQKHEHNLTSISHDLLCCSCKTPAPSLEKLKCNHTICERCLSTITKNPGRKKCPECKKTIANRQQESFNEKLNEDLNGDMKSSFKEESKSHSSPQEAKETCVICLEDLDDDDVKELPCKHKFCHGCIDQAFKVKPVCPSCGMICGQMKGDQPPGTMTTTHQRWDLPGYAGQGTIEINYRIPSGTQTKAHPSPGRRFQGTHRTAYLPNNNEGKHIEKLLRRAFNAQLIFTVGTSTTSGSSNVVTWNDIHHKTNSHGGPDNYGYPDPTYLKRVKSELSAKGIE